MRASRQVLVLTLYPEPSLGCRPFCHLFLPVKITFFISSLAEALTKRISEGQLSPHSVVNMETFPWDWQQGKCSRLPLLSKLVLGFPGGASGEEPICHHRGHKREEFEPWFGQIPQRRAEQHVPVFLPGESRGRGNLAGYAAHRVTEATEQAGRPLLFSEEKRWIALEH